MDKELSAVFVTNSFPPSGGSGVQRVAKFVKYLPNYGIETSVITAKNILNSTSDTTLLDDLNSSVKIIRTISIDPMFLNDFFNNSNKSNDDNTEKKSIISSVKKKLFPFILRIRDFARLPDQYILWFPFAFFAGMRHLRSLESPVIIGSLPTYTTALVAYAMSKMSGAPLVLDFRDSWTDDPYLRLPTFFHKSFHKYLETKILSHAKYLVVYNSWLSDIYSVRYHGVPNKVILNGYDDIDFEVEPRKKDNIKKLVFSHVGTVFDYHHDFIDLLFSQLSKLEISKKNMLEVYFAGEVQLKEFDDLIEKYDLKEIIFKLGYIPHKEATSLMLGSDALLFTIPKDDKISYTGKIYEYLGSRRPIVSFVSKGGLGSSLLEEFGHGDWIIDYTFEEGLDVFSKIIDLKEHRMKFDKSLYAKISRRNQAEQLAKILKKVALMNHD